MPPHGHPNNSENAHKPQPPNSNNQQQHHHLYHSTTPSSSTSFKGCCCCLFLLFSFLALLILVVFLVIIKVVKPKKPQFDLQLVGSSLTDFTESKPISVGFDFTTRFYRVRTNFNGFDFTTWFYRFLHLTRKIVHDFNNNDHNLSLLYTLKKLQESKITTKNCSWPAEWQMHTMPVSLALWWRLPNIIVLANIKKIFCHSITKKATKYYSLGNPS